MTCLTEAAKRENVQALTDTVEVSHHNWDLGDDSHGTILVGWAILIVAALVIETQHADTDCG